jgi:O-antigen/teichoic acid export membrane protein
LSKPNAILSENEVHLVAKSGLIDGISRFIAYGLSFVVNVLLARLTGAAAIGSVSVTLSALNTIQIIPGMGLSLAILRKMSLFIGSRDRCSAARIARTSYLFVFSAACILVVAYFWLIRKFAYALILRSTGSVAVFDSLAIAFPLICLLPLLAATFTALQQTYKSTQYDQIVRNLLRLCSTAVALLFLTKINALLIGTITGICASVFIQILIISKIFKNFSPAPGIHSGPSPSARMLNMLVYGVPLMLVPLLNAASREIDLWIVGFYLTSKQAGIYAIIRILGATLLIPILMFGEIFGVSIAKLRVSSDKNAVCHLNAIAAKWIGLLSGIGFVIVSCFSGDILAIFGKEYLAGSAALRIYAVGQLIHGLFGATGTLLLMYDRRTLLIANGIFSVIVNLALSLTLTPRYGILGAAIGMALTFSSTSILVLIMTLKSLKIPPGSFFVYMKRIFIIVLSYLLMQYISSLFPGVHYSARLIFGIILTLILMTPLFWITEKWDASERQILASLYKRLFTFYRPKPA